MPHRDGALGEHLDGRRRRRARALLCSIGWFSTAFIVTAISSTDMPTSRRARSPRRDPVSTTQRGEHVGDRRRHRNPMPRRRIAHRRRARPATFHSNAARRPTATETAVRDVVQRAERMTDRVGDAGAAVVDRHAGEVRRFLHRLPRAPDQLPSTATRGRCASTKAERRAGPTRRRSSCGADRCTPRSRARMHRDRCRP